MIENIISLSLFLVIVLGVFEVFSLSQKHFTRIKTEQETSTSVFSALDKIKSDLLLCGEGFPGLKFPELAPPLSNVENMLILRRIEKTYPSLQSLSVGQIRISFDNTAEFKRGKTLHIADLEKGEVIPISAVDSSGIVLCAPLQHSYASEETSLSLLEIISFFLDGTNNILRRKVNASPAQPLCENVGSFECLYSRESNLLKISMTFQTNLEHTYEIFLFPKNPALSAWH